LSGKAANLKWCWDKVKADADCTAEGNGYFNVEYSATQTTNNGNCSCCKDGTKWDGPSANARVNLYQNKGWTPSPTTATYYPLVAGVNLRKYGNCMYRDASHPLRNFYPNEEYVDLTTEKDCVDWCESKKNKCLYMIYQPGAGAAGKGRCYRTS